MAVAILLVGCLVTRAGRVRRGRQCTGEFRSGLVRHFNEPAQRSVGTFGLLYLPQNRSERPVRARIQWE